MSESNQQNPLENLDRKALSRASIVGVGLSVFGIVLFIVLYVVMNNAGVDAFPRLLISFCVPPAVIAGLIGLYMLISTNRSKD